MNEKKRFSIFGLQGVLLGLILSMFFVSNVFAYGYFPDTRYVAEGMIDFYVDFFEPILSALFGGFGWTGFYLFERFLIFVILVSLLSVILKKVPTISENKWVMRIISIIVPLIGIRFMNFETVEALIFQYEWLAIGLTAILPMLLFFFFVYNIGDHPFLRKGLWLFMLAIYLGLWSTVDSVLSGQIYFWTVVAIVLCVMFDNLIYRYFYFNKIKENNSYWKAGVVARIQGDLDRLIRDYHMPDRDKVIKKKRKELAWWQKKSY